MNRLFALLLSALLTAGLAAQSSKGAEGPKGYEVVAEYLYLTAKFVEWPGLDPAAPCVLGILGGDPFGDAFEPFRGKLVRGRSFQVKKSRDLRDLEDCQMLFICLSENDDVGRILQHFKGKPVLLFGEHVRFTELGGGARFNPQEHGFQIEINLRVAEEQHLRISSFLLRQALVVRY